MIEDLYAKKFKNDRNDGRPAYASRIAFGAIYIKEQENLTDERTVEYIAENPYVQYFLGLHEFVMEPLFDPSMMVCFRKRFPAKDVAEINEELFHRTHKDNNFGNDNGDDSDNTSVEAENSSEEESKNEGVLIIDAICAPSDIRYPQDLSLLNECRENL